MLCALNSAPGSLGGTTVLCLCFLLGALMPGRSQEATNSSTPKFTTLLNFSGKNDVDSGMGALVQGTDGNLYGTLYSGGLQDGFGGLGTVFKVTLKGTLTTLHKFDDGVDGSNPIAGLVQATNGNFYGTTTNNNNTNSFYSTVFEITPEGKFTNLYDISFLDGQFPTNAMVQATNGNLYGTTLTGGAIDAQGVVFEITPKGVYTDIHNFGEQADEGLIPAAGLVQVTNGDLYGSTYQGGTFGYGTIFKISLEGALTTLHSFTNCASNCPGGGLPTGTLVQGTDGNLYGTTTAGPNAAPSSGTVFKITPEGTLTTLHTFHGTDGGDPVAGLVQGSDGNFYGITEFGGTKNEGTVFKITPEGTLTTLHSFGGTDGANPAAALIQATDGNFYGTTSTGGAHGDGTMFRLDVGLAPFVATTPTMGKIGAGVEILGNDLAGATEVTFNGKVASFKVISATEITASVPDDATTGKIEVKLPTSTLSSNIPFYLTP